MSGASEPDIELESAVHQFAQAFTRYEWTAESPGTWGDPEVYPA
jgi:hypothetical protein